MGPRMFQYAFCAVMASAAVMVTTPVTAQVLLPAPTVTPGPATPTAGPDWLTQYGLCGYTFPGGVTLCEVPVLPGTGFCDSQTCSGGVPPAGDFTCDAGQYNGGVTSDLNDCRFNIGAAPLNLSYSVRVDVPFRILMQPNAVDGNAGLCSDVNGIWFKAGTLGYNIVGVAAGNYRVRPYLLDFGGNRAEDVKACVLDSSDVLKACSDPVAMATFGIGEWAAFDVKLAAGDKVRLEHTQTAGDNAVVSGVFFDPLAADPPCANGIACANGLDTATHGDWPLVPYGTAGRIIFNRDGPTGINLAQCPVVDATTYVDKFTTAVTVAADNGVCQYRWDGPVNGCDNLEDAMTWVHAPRVNTGDPLTCIPADNRGFNVPAECQHLYNVCVGPSDPTTQVGPLAAPTWDDAGERTGPVADGPDLKIGFHVPDGVWQVCFYMVDYDSQARSQVLELPGWANQTVSGFGDGATVCYPGLMGGDYTLKVRSTAGPNSVISSIGWVRLDGQGQPVTDPELCAGLGECEPCSYTQGGWGQTAKGGNVGTLRDAHFSEVYPAGVTVGQATCTGGAAGSGNVMTFASSLAVENFLPCGGTPDMLSKDYSNPTCGTGSGATSSALKKLLGKSALSTNEIKNVFAAQVLALKLNVDFSDHLTTAPDVPLGNLLITEGAFAGMTVRAFLAEAEEALSCGDLNYMVGGEQKSVMTIGAFNEAASNINESRDECEVQTEFTACPVGVAAR